MCVVHLFPFHAHFAPLSAHLKPLFLSLSLPLFLRAVGQGAKKILYLSIDEADVKGQLLDRSIDLIAKQVEIIEKPAAATAAAAPAGPKPICAGTHSSTALRCAGHCVCLCLLGGSVSGAPECVIRTLGWL